MPTKRTAKPQMLLDVTYTPLVECEECSWSIPARDAAAQAKMHVKVWGHSVNVTHRRVVKYGPSATPEIVWRDDGSDSARTSGE